MDKVGETPALAGEPDGQGQVAPLQQGARGFTRLDNIIVQFADVVDEWRRKGLTGARKTLEKALDMTLDTMLEEVIFDPMREEMRRREAELVKKYGYQELRGLSTYTTAEIYALSQPREKDKEYWEKLTGAVRLARDLHRIPSSEA